MGGRKNEKRPNGRVDRGPPLQGCIIARRRNHVRIRTATIHNFRSIRHASFQLGNAVTLLGPNNHGKSNIVSAIEFALTTAAKPSEETFYALRQQDDPMWVEVTFTELTDQERTTFKRYVQADGTFCLRKTARLSGGAVEVTYNGYVEEPEESWLQADSVRLLTDRAEIGKTPLAALVPPSGRLIQAMVQSAQEQYIASARPSLHFKRTLESSPLLGQKNVGGGVLPEFFLVPAVRDLADETKVKSTTIFGRLLNRAVREMADRDPRFLELKDGLAGIIMSLNRPADGQRDQRPEQLVALEEAIRDELTQWGVKVEIEVVPPVVEKIFELGTNLQLDDGVRTLAEQKGHGLQRAVIFALIRAWANVLHHATASGPSMAARASSESVVFAIEEPELFLHPHAQRKLARSISQIAATPDHQVLVCSHSTHFVDLDQYKSICIVSKSSAAAGTLVRQCAGDLFEEQTNKDRKRRFHMAHWLNPDRGEMFFAKRAVFVEGETEKVVLPFLAEVLGCLDHEVSIIDCGCKHNLPLYIAIANAFEVPYTVIHDEDPVPDPVPEGMRPEVLKEKVRTFNLNEEIRGDINTTIGRIHVLSPDFEGAARISKTRADKIGKALVALDFFSEVDPGDVPESLRIAVRLAFCERADGCTADDCRACEYAPALAAM